MNYLKRYSVQLDAHIVAVFDNLDQAKEFVEERWYYAFATIWDHVQNCLVYDQVRI